MQILDYDKSETPRNEDLHIIECSAKNKEDKNYLRKKAEEYGEIVMEITTREGCVFLLRVGHFPKRNSNTNPQRHQEIDLQPLFPAFLV